MQTFIVIITVMLMGGKKGDDNWKIKRRQKLTIKIQEKGERDEWTH